MKIQATKKRLSCQTDPANKVTTPYCFATKTKSADFSPSPKSPERGSLELIFSNTERISLITKILSLPPFVRRASINFAAKGECFPAMPSDTYSLPSEGNDLALSFSREFLNPHLKFVKIKPFRQYYFIYCD